MTAETEDYPSKITLYVVVCWILAAFGGLMFGYDIGISGFTVFFNLSNFLYLFTLKLLVLIMENLSYR